MKTKQNMQILSDNKNYFDQVESIHDVKISGQNSNSLIVELSFKKTQTGVKWDSYRTDYLLYERKKEQVTRLNTSHFASKTYSSESSRSIAGFAIKTFKKDDKLYLEVWKDDILMKTVNVSHLFEFMYDNFSMSKPEWNMKGNKVVFMAERKVIKDRTFYQAYLNTEQELDSFINQSDELKGTGIPENHVYYTQLYTMDMETYQINCYNDILKDLNVDVLRAKLDCMDKIVFLGVEKGIYKYTLKCFNRKNDLYLIRTCVDEKTKVKEKCNKDIDFFKITKTQVIKITNDRLFTVLLFKFTTDWKRIIMVGRRNMFVEHNTCFELLTLNHYEFLKGEKCKIKTLIDVVKERRNDFNGIYIGKMKGRVINQIYILNENGRDYVIFNTVVNGRIGLFYIDTDKMNEVKRHPLSKTNSNCILHAIDKKTKTLVIEEVNNHSEPVFRIVEGISNKNVILMKDSYSKYNGETKKMLLEYLKATSKELWTKKKAHGFLLISPRAEESNKPLPLIVYPHGGPFSFSPMSKSFDFDQIYLLYLGFNLLIVNFRGSLGYGYDYLKELIDSAGDVATQDTKDLINSACKAFPSYISKNEIGLYGFSFGGLVTSLLTCDPQFNHRIKTSIIYNANIVGALAPVCENKPEWYYSLVKTRTNNVEWPITLNNLKSFSNLLTLEGIQKIKCPVLIVCSKQDKSVSYHNGKYFYNCLREYRCDCDLIIYEDSRHWICKKEDLLHFRLSTINWFVKNLL